MKKKIAILIDNMNDGGAQRVIMNNIRDWILDDTINVKLFVLQNTLGKWCKAEFKNKKYQIKLIDCSCCENLSKFKNYIFLPLKLLKFLKRYKADVIHGHVTPLLKTTLLPIIFAKQKLAFFTLHSNPFRIIGLDYWFARISFNLFGIIPVCLNEEQAKMAMEHYKFKKYELLHNGVDFERIRKNIVSKSEARKQFGIDQNVFVLCACGRLDNVKNYPLMLNIFKNLLVQNNKAVLLIAGEGPEKEKLIQYSNKLGINEKVIFLGNLFNVVPLYCSSDTFIMTSESEASPLVLLEAQKCGCKCIISSGVPKESIITDKVVSMKENASIEDWVNAILSENVTYEKPRFTEADYEVHAMSQKCKEMYLRYLEGYNDEK